MIVIMKNVKTGIVTQGERGKEREIEGDTGRGIKGNRSTRTYTEKGRVAGLPAWAAVRLQHRQRRFGKLARRRRLRH